MMAIPGFTAQQTLTASGFLYRAGARKATNGSRLHPMQEGENYDTSGGQGEGDPGDTVPPDNTGDGTPPDGTPPDDTGPAYDPVAFTRNYDTLTCTNDCTNGIADPACNDCEAMIDSRQCTDALQCQEIRPHVTVCTCHVPPLVS